MNDCTEIGFREDDTTCSPMVQSIAFDLSSELCELQASVLEDAPRLNDRSFILRHHVERLVNVCSTSPGDVSLKFRTLELLAETIGVQSDCYRILSRSLGVPPPPCDPEWLHL